MLLDSRHKLIDDGNCAGTASKHKRPSIPRFRSQAQDSRLDSSRMTELGIAITVANVVILAIGFIWRRRNRLPVYGWIGLALLLVAEFLMFRGVSPVNIYFTPIAWTAYILIADAMVLAICGRSRLHDRPWTLLQTAIFSVLLWLIFELYNLRLANWTYVGVPMTWTAALFGYVWSFATIIPAIFETADLIEAFGWYRAAEPIRFPRAAEYLIASFGALCLLVPLVVPRSIAAYLFVLVWVGFVFLLDPLNHRLGWPSLLGDLAVGRRSRFYSLLISGWICGWLWEFWNYWAAAKWHYVFPMFQRYKIFEMPVVGYIGFLPFALECFVMYTTADAILRRRNARQKEIPEDRQLT